MLGPVWRTDGIYFRRGFSGVSLVLHRIGLGLALEAWLGPFACWLVLRIPGVLGIFRYLSAGRRRGGSLGLIGVHDPFLLRLRTVLSRVVSGFVLCHLVCRPLVVGIGGVRSVGTLFL